MSNPPNLVCAVVKCLKSPPPDRRHSTCNHVHWVVQQILAPALEFPPEKRPMGRRRTVPIAHSSQAEATILRWHSAPDDVVKGSVSLRLTISVDHRVEHRVQVANASTREVFNTAEVLYGCPGQVVECELTQQQAQQALNDGLALSLESASEPLWIITSGGDLTTPTILPHLCAANERCDEETFLNLFCSSASLQPCDWMGNCVVDGLRDWADLGREDARQELLRQLDLYFNPVTGERDNIRGCPDNDAPGGPERSGPWTTLARVFPTNSQASQYTHAIELAARGFDVFYDKSLDYVGHVVVAETSYNIAYPMMAFATQCSLPKYKQRALQQLEVNRHYLCDENNLWLRYIPQTQERTFRNWSRGVAWYYMGLVRTLELLPSAERPVALLHEVERVAQWVAKYQNSDGLWSCYLHEPQVTPDTSGCAGIAAAIAIAVKQGMLDRQYLSIAEQARQGLMNCLAGDGWLRGVSQSNKKESHAIDIQRIPYRIIAPWGMGLLAQLLAALR